MSALPWFINCRIYFLHQRVMQKALQLAFFFYLPQALRPVSGRICRIVHLPVKSWGNNSTDTCLPRLAELILWKELQKTNQTEFRVAKVIKKKVNKLYVKWKGLIQWNLPIADIPNSGHALNSGQNV